MYPFRYSFLNPERDEPTSYPYRNIVFNSPEDLTSPVGNDTEQTSQPDFLQAYRELLTRKEGPSLAAYRKFISQGYPEENQYRPSKLSRLGAILSGAATGLVNPAQAPAVAQSILERPYEKAVKRYGAESQRLREAASLEESMGQHDLQRLQTVSSIENQRQDNARADTLANSLIKQRDLNMQLTQKRIENEGMRSQLDKTTGILYLIKPDGTKTSVGKFDQSTGEKLADVKATKGFESSLTEGRQKRLAGVRFGQEKEIEDIRQENRKELVGERANRQIEILRERAKLPRNRSTIDKLRENFQKVDALVDSDPDTFEDIWIINPQTGLKELNPEHAGTPAYKKLYDLLYSGFTGGNATTTPKGRTIER